MGELNIDGQKLHMAKFVGTNLSSGTHVGGPLSLSGYLQDGIVTELQSMPTEQKRKHRLFSILWPKVQILYHDAPSIHRSRNVSNIDNKARRDLENNRRYIVGGELCFSLQYTDTSVPIDFVELDKGSAFFEFEDVAGFQYNGYDFNQIYFIDTNVEYQFAAYTSEGSALFNSAW